MTDTGTVILELERTRDEVVKYFSLSDSDLARTYAQSKWSVRHLLNHLSDSELVFGERIRRGISEPRTEVRPQQERAVHGERGVRRRGLAHGAPSDADQAGTGEVRSIAGVIKP